MYLRRGEGYLSYDPYIAYVIVLMGLSLIGETAESPTLFSRDVAICSVAI